MGKEHRGTYVPRNHYDGIERHGKVIDQRVVAT